MTDLRLSVPRAVNALGQGKAGMTRLFSITARWDQQGDHHTPIASDDDGNCYYAVMSGSNVIEVGKWTQATGQISTTTLTPTETGTDANHHNCSIFIDTSGYLHVIAPCHNTDFEWWTADVAQSVSGGFTLRSSVDHPWTGQTNASHKHITYPWCFYDNNLNPWLSMRVRVAATSWLPGTQGAGLSRYNTSTDDWNNIGGNTNSAFTGITGTPEPKPQVFWWTTESTASDSGYNSYYTKPFYDQNGRLHWAATLCRQGTNDNSWNRDQHYLYSDDDGVTWRFADGTSVSSDPVVLDNYGSLDSRYWINDAGNGNNHIYGSNFPACTGDGRTVVGYSRRAVSSGSGTSHIAIWENGSWNETDLGIDEFPTRLVITNNNIWMLVGADIRVSTDEGASWSTQSSGYSGSDASAWIDTRHFKRTNRVRFCANPNAGAGTKTIEVIEYIPTGWAPPSY